jgi:uncharacterized protein (DUF427 family)
MAKAIWNGKVIAESNKTVEVEGNKYFPQQSLKKEFFKKSQTNHTSTCPWKGIAGYYDIEVDGKVNENAAWHYPEPKPEAAKIKGHVAFWNGVEVEE